MRKRGILSIHFYSVVDFSYFHSYLQNCGEEISLRLRTDDLKGFRKYESIKKTLLHELVSYNMHHKFHVVLEPKHFK